jgi:hypothetical protein
MVDGLARCFTGRVDNVHSIRTESSSDCFSSYADCVCQGEQNSNIGRPKVGNMIFWNDKCVALDDRPEGKEGNAFVCFAYNAGRFYSIDYPTEFTIR